MARMLRAHAARWQCETATYGYEVKGDLRAHEERSWRRDWAEDEVALRLRELVPELFVGRPETGRRDDHKPLRILRGPFGGTSG